MKKNNSWNRAQQSRKSVHKVNMLVKDSSYRCQESYAFLCTRNDIFYAKYHYNFDSIFLIKVFLNRIYLTPTYWKSKLSAAYFDNYDLSTPIITKPDINWCMEQRCLHEKFQNVKKSVRRKKTYINHQISVL